MFTDAVVPLLVEKMPPENPIAVCTLKITGLGESLVERRIASALAGLDGLGVGYCARVGEVDVRLSTRGDAALLDQAEAAVRGKIGEFIYGQGDDSLEEVVVHELTTRGQTLAVAESCTGGLLAHRITNVPGASAVFLAGHCTYSNAAKVNTLGVKNETLAAHGAVSEAVAREMAEGARARHGADYALSTTGIAGPSGGTAEKPVGTVFIALAGSGETRVLNPRNSFDRETFKFVTTQQALDLLRRGLAK
jgi:nicotinamide-nucleotide amidase